MFGFFFHNTVQGGIITFEKREYVYLLLVFQLPCVYLRIDYRIAFIYFTCMFTELELPCTYNLNPHSISWTSPPVPASLLILCAARPEFLGRLLAWSHRNGHLGSGEHSAETISLNRNTLLNFHYRSSRGAGIYWHVHHGHILDLSVAYMLP